MLKEFLTYYQAFRDLALSKMTLEALQELGSMNRERFELQYSKRGLGYFIDVSFLVLYVLIALPVLALGKVDLTLEWTFIGLMLLYVLSTIPSKLIRANLLKTIAQDKSYKVEKIAFMLHHKAEMPQIKEILRLHLYSYVTGKRELPAVFDNFSHLDPYFEAGNQLKVFTCAEICSAPSSNDSTSGKTLIEPSALNIKPLHVLKTELEDLIRRCKSN